LNFESNDSGFIRQSSLENEIESGGEGWVIAEDKEENIFTIVAQWINQWLPVGGVEAGRIGN